MQTNTQKENPILNPSASTIIDSPIINDSAIINGDQPIYEDVSCGCSANVPAGSRVFYMKLVGTMTIIGGLLTYGIIKLLDYI